MKSPKAGRWTPVKLTGVKLALYRGPRGRLVARIGKRGKTGR